MPNRITFEFFEPPPEAPIRRIDERLPSWGAELSPETHDKAELFPPGAFLRNFHLGSILGIVLRRMWRTVVGNLGWPRGRRR